MEKMYPPPDQNWPDLLKLTKIAPPRGWVQKIFAPHSGWVQEFASNNGIAMSNDGLGPPVEEIVRRVWNTAYLLRSEERTSGTLELWREKLEFLGLPDHCFPSAPNGWQNHIESNDPRCFPKYYDAQSSCPPNQNLHLSSV